MDIGGSMVQESSPQVAAQYEIFSADGDEPALQAEQDYFVQVGYMHAISDMRDLDYFEEKLEQLELACGKWMDILSTHWEASTVGNQICQDLRSDPSGGEAVETLKACFGTKSPNTLLKRAATLRKYLVWHYNEFNSRGVYVHAFPLVESDVWNFFKWLRVERQQKSRGFTTTSTFLETVRFCKFTVGLQGCDVVLGSGRLLGFAAVELPRLGATDPWSCILVSTRHPLLGYVVNSIYRSSSLGKVWSARIGSRSC
ncbi:unnamed protein product [Durusdinium trenchii]|uniref:Core-binding (CB) domain-containing protein n=1 Tax=Durusdinium trenchii TaxID=1381693 RepID=A0ABP0SZ16_9DINO